MGEQTAKASGLNRAKTYQLVLFPLNNGATNVYYVLVLSYIATFGSKVLALSMIFASVMVTGNAPVRRHYRPHHRRVDGPHQRQIWQVPALHGHRQPHHGGQHPRAVLSDPAHPRHAMGLRYAAVVALYAVWVIGYTFQTSCTRSGQTV
jgi:hypothetical protein